MSEKGVKKIGGFIPEIPTRTLSRFPLLQIKLQLIIFILIQNAGSCFVVLVAGFLFVCLICFLRGLLFCFKCWTPCCEPLPRAIVWVPALSRPQAPAAPSAAAQQARACTAALQL